MVHVRCGVSLAALVALAGAGCGGQNVASELARPPELPSKESKCGNTRIQARPLIVEWPSSDRAALEARIKQGLVPVRYVGCDMEVLTTCKVSSMYSYTGITPKSDKVVIHNSDELYANIPVYAAKFEGKLQKAGALEVDMTIIGRYDAGRDTIRTDELQGSCREATHVITALTVGAFKFSAGASADVSAGGSVGDIGAGARSSASNETLNTDGDGKQCEKATGNDSVPPFGCGALLRVELVPLDKPRENAPTCPGGTSWDGSQCIAVVNKSCPEGTHYEGGKGCLANIAGASAANAGGAKPAAEASAGGPCGASAVCAEEQKACDAGDNRACVRAGEIFYNARGVAKDGARAAALFKQACSKDELTGCVDLGWAYVTGTGVPKDGASAALFFGKACNDKTTMGCLGLGTLHLQGSGVPRDKAHAGALFKQACEGGITAGCKMLKDIQP